MTAQSSAEASSRIGAADYAPPVAEVARWTLGALAGLILATAAMIAWRRAIGALNSPLQAPLFIGGGVLLAGVALAFRTAWNYLSIGEQRTTLDLGVWIAPTPMLLLAGIGLSLPGTHVAALTVFWVLIVAEEAWSWRTLPWRTRRLRFRVATDSKDTPETPKVKLHEPAVGVLDVERPAASLVDEIPAEQVTQHLTRSIAEDGIEQVAGWLRVPFHSGQRTGNVHVAFCPPFAKVPKLKVDQVEGRPARIKTAQLLPHGVRLDLKLSASADGEESVLLKFTAKAPAEE